MAISITHVYLHEVPVYFVYFLLKDYKYIKPSNSSPSALRNPNLKGHSYNRLTFLLHYQVTSTQEITIYMCVILLNSLAKS